MLFSLLTKIPNEYLPSGAGFALRKQNELPTRSGNRVYMLCFSPDGIISAS